MVGLIVKDPRSTEYLYNVKGKHFCNFSYIGALKEKIRLGKKLLKGLLNEQLDSSGITVDEWFIIEERINKVVNAIHHNEFLLKEVEDGC